MSTMPLGESLSQGKSSPPSDMHANNLLASKDEALIGPDFSWVADPWSRYSRMLVKVPDVLSWSSDATAYYSRIHVFARNVAVRRFRSLLAHIARYDAQLRDTVSDTFSALSMDGQVRFLTAPSTYFSILRFRREPIVQLRLLCNALNAEAAREGLCQAKAGYTTALGDEYYSSPLSHAVEQHTSFKLGGLIPVDFASRHAQIAQETSTKIEYDRYAPAESLSICEALEGALVRIRSVSPHAAKLVEANIKVIVPLKVSSGSGSTSQPHYPGRVLLRGVERSDPATIASALIHEATHQVLYIIEFGGPFVIPDPEIWASRTRSLWTGRDLPMHSFIHACFVWYGLSQFWSLDSVEEAFDGLSANRELSRCTSGFRNGNPIDALGNNRCMLRYDVVKVAASLRDRLSSNLGWGCLPD